MTNPGQEDIKNRVGPILRAGELSRAAVEAIEIDNPDGNVTIEDKIAYVRVSADRECVIKRETLESCLGRPVRMQELETVLGSFAGQIEATEDYVRFYFDKER